MLIITLGAAEAVRTSRYAQNYRLFQEKVAAILSSEDKYDPAAQNKVCQTPS